MNTNARLCVLTFAVALLGSACQTMPTHTTADFNRLRPRSVLVLPPENTTPNTDVLEKAYPHVFSKLAQRGYYAVSPELALQLFRANKLNDPGRINSLPTQKFKEVFGVDAVLKTKVTDWSSKYVVISSMVTVGLEMSLYDCATGKLLWSHKNSLSKAPDSNGGGLVGALVNAAVNAAFTQYEPIAAENAAQMLSTLPKGVVNVKPE
jgi:hypothetical protein